MFYHCLKIVFIALRALGDKRASNPDRKKFVARAAELFIYLTEFRNQNDDAKMKSVLLMLPKE